MTTPSSDSPPREVRVAIVGSGLTGLVATYLLTAPTTDSSGNVRITVEIFERAATLGMDSASISVPLPIAPASTIPASSQTTSTCVSNVNDNDALRPRSPKRIKLQTQPSANDADPKQVQSSMRIDVPMRAFTGGYYPQLLALYRHLGIRIKETNFTYSFASLSTSQAAPLSALVSPSDTATSSPPSEAWPSPLKAAPIDSSVDIQAPHETAAPSPSILYNGANGFRGVSLPTALRCPHLSSPVRVSDVLNQINAIRAYFGTLVMLILGYLQLLVIALWHHHLGHTCDSAHPLRTYTLIDLIREPFPARSPVPNGSPTGLYTRLGLLIEWMVEYALRRIVCLDVRFARQTLTPLFSAVMTSSLDSVWASPASQVLDYVALTLGKDHFVVKDGVRTVVASLLTHMEDPAPEAPQSSGSSSRSKVWTNAEVRHVHSKGGRAWIHVVHHRREASPQHETPSMSRAPSSTSTDRTFCSEQDELQQHGPFDHVIFATQANQTAHFLEQYVDSLAATAEEEQERLGQVMDVLTQFKYERSVVVNHTDRGLLPRDRADWRDLNLVSPTPRVGAKGWEGGRRGSDSEWIDEGEMDGSASNDTLVSMPAKGVPGKSAYTMATHVLTLPPSANLLVMQTTNPHASLNPRPGTVLSHSTFERAVIDVPAHLARERLFRVSASSAAGGAGGKVRTAGGRCLALGELQQQRGRGAGVWVCGSWAVGIPLLEGCVVSARLVAEEILRSEGRGKVGAAARW